MPKRITFAVLILAVVLPLAAETTTTTSSVAPASADAVPATTTTTTVAPFPFRAYSIGDNVNVRALDGTYRDWNVPVDRTTNYRAYPVAGQLMRGDVVQVQTNRGYWLKIERYDGLAGWVASNYIGGQSGIWQIRFPPALVMSNETTNLTFTMVRRFITNEGRFYLDSLGRATNAPPCLNLKKDRVQRGGRTVYRIAIYGDNGRVRNTVELGETDAYYYEAATNRFQWSLEYDFRYPRDLLVVYRIARRNPGSEIPENLYRSLDRIDEVLLYDRNGKFLVKFPGRYNMFSVSPDSTLFVGVDAGFNIGYDPEIDELVVESYALYNAATGKVLYLTNVRGDIDIFPRVRFSPDSRYVALTYRRGALVLDKDFNRIYERDTYMLECRFSMDSRCIFGPIGGGGADPQIFLFHNLKTGRDLTAVQPTEQGEDSYGAVYFLDMPDENTLKGSAYVSGFTPEGGRIRDWYGVLYRLGN